MSRPKPADILFWVLATVAAAMVAVFALALAGTLPVEEPQPAAGPGETSTPATTEAAAPDPVTEPGTTTEASTPASAPETTTAASTPAPPRQITVVVSAARGDCWLSARVGSPSGRLLAEQLLLQGESIRLRAPKVWLSLGASGNVDVLVDGEPHEVSPGTVAVVLERDSSS